MIENNEAKINEEGGYKDIIQGIIQFFHAGIFSFVI